MGHPVRDHQPVVAREPGARRAVLRLPGGHPQGHLYDERHRVGEYVVAQIIKNRGSFPTDEAAVKLLYLALQNIARKWTMPIKEWKAALNRFAVIFEDRMPAL